MPARDLNAVRGEHRRRVAVAVGDQHGFRRNARGFGYGAGELGLLTRCQPEQIELDADDRRVRASTGGEHEHVCEQWTVDAGRPVVPGGAPKPVVDADRRGNLGAGQADPQARCRRWDAPPPARSCHRCTSGLIDSARRGHQLAVYPSSAGVAAAAIRDYLLTTDVRSGLYRFLPVVATIPHPLPDLSGLSQALWDQVAPLATRGDRRGARVVEVQRTPAVRLVGPTRLLATEVRHRVAVAVVQEALPGEDADDRHRHPAVNVQVRLLARADGLREVVVGEVVSSAVTGAGRALRPVREPGVVDPLRQLAELQVPLVVDDADAPRPPVARP